MGVMSEHVSLGLQHGHVADLAEKGHFDIFSGNTSLTSGSSGADKVATQIKLNYVIVEKGLITGKKANMSYWEGVAALYADWHSHCFISLVKVRNALY